MNLTESITLIARETGWTLEYIGEMPVNQFQVLLNEVVYQKDCETYQDAYNAAMIVCALINSKERHYTPENIIGERPERGEMTETNELESITMPDGKVYKLWPLTVNMMVAVQGKFGKTEIGEMTTAPNFEVLRMMYYLRAQKCHPEVTLEEAGEMALTEMSK